MLSYRTLLFGTIVCVMAAAPAMADIPQPLPGPIHKSDIPQPLPGPVHKSDIPQPLPGPIHKSDIPQPLPRAVVTLIASKAGGAIAPLITLLVTH